MKTIIKISVFILSGFSLFSQEVIMSGEALYRHNHAIINNSIGDYYTRNSTKKADVKKPVLTFKRSESLSKQIQQGFIDQLSIAQPEIRTKLEHEFANNKLRNQFDQLLKSYGYSANDLGDAMTAYLVITWQVVNGKEYNNRNGFNAVRKMIKDVLLSSPELAQATNAQKQTVAETYAYQSMIAMSTYQDLKAKKDHQGMETFRNEVYHQSKNSGFDLKTVVLNEKGFVKL